MIHLVFSQGTDLGARAIRWWGRARWNHVRIWDSEELSMWEAIQRVGVRRVAPWWPAPEHLVTRPDLTAAQAEVLTAFLRAQEGKAYDWAAVLRFVTRDKQAWEAEDRRWFCSELAAAALAAAGAPVLRLPPEQVSPGMLAALPCLRVVELSGMQTAI